MQCDRAEGEGVVMTKFRGGKEKTALKRKVYKLISSNINTMNNQDLTQYLFWDGHEEIANPNGRLVAIRDPEQGVQNYLPSKSRLRARYVQGSTLDIYSGKISREPQEGEQLLTRSWFLGWFEAVSNSRIKEINKKFRLPQESK